MSGAAEPIARVVDDLRHGRVQHLVKHQVINRKALELAQRRQPVVDVTAIYRDLYHRLNVLRKPVDVYGDHPSIAPPWESALVGFVIEHGTVVVLQMSSTPWPDGLTWETPNTVDWPRCRWLVETYVFVGGINRNGPLATTGPLHLLQYAVYDDGEPADLHWVQILPEESLETWEVPQLTLLATLHFLNCKNVKLAEPVRSRPERRRLARLGVTVQAIVVRPIGRRKPSGAAGQESATPLTSVRGHFAVYGEQFGRGKLFGKYEGRYWIPAHARGSAEHGGGQRDYVLRPGGPS